MKKTKVDLTGKKVGILTVLCKGAPYEYKIHTGPYAGNAASRARWRCVCDCGKECLVTTWLLVHKSRLSCGCVNLMQRSERMKQINAKRKKERARDCLDN